MRSLFSNRLPARGRPSLPLSIIVTALAVVFAATLVSSPAQAADWKGKEVVLEGATHVQNPATPTQPASTLSLEEQWRLGGYSDNEDEFFGIINEVLTDAEGNIYLLDNQLSEVKVYSPDGEFLRIIGREGEGPGEFRNPTDMCFLPDGNIGVVQVAPGRIVLLTPEGDPAGEHAIPSTEDGGAVFLLNAGSTGGNLVLAYMMNKFETGKMDQMRILACVDAEGTVVKQLHEETRTLDFANVVFDEATWDTFDRKWTVGPDGRIFAVVQHADYKISVWNPDGSFDRVIEREYTRRARTADEKAEVEGIFEAFTRQVPNATIKIDDNWADVQSIHPRADGSLWVLTSQGGVDPGEGVIGIFDVFDAKGRFVTQVTLEGEGDPSEDGYFFVGERLYIVTDFLDAAMAAQGGGSEATMDEDEEAEPMSVICYELGALGYGK